MKRYLLIGATLAMSGCTSHQIYFDKPGGTQAQFQRDMGDCKMAGLYAPQEQAPQLPPNYVANTTYNNTYTGSYGMVNQNGTATTTVQAQPNPYQGLVNLSTAIGNKVRQQRTVEYCMQAKGYTMRKSG